MDADFLNHNQLLKTQGLSWFDREFKNICGTTVFSAWSWAHLEKDTVLSEYVHEQDGHFARDNVV